MKPRYRYLVISFLLGLLVWFSDSVLDTLLFNEGDFWDMLLLEIPENEFWDRVVTLSTFTVFGVIVSQVMGSRLAAEEELKRVNDQLIATNKELKAFTYSVSHDLKAPLRYVHGFTSLLESRIENNCDEETLGLMENIQSSVEKMNLLVKALLNLSTAQEGTIEARNLDLTIITENIAQEYQEREPERLVELKIEKGMLINYDEALLKVLMVNLIGNAWKYTSKKKDAQIEIGTVDQNGDKIFFIKDNGVGFDQCDVDQLFIPFQRLHHKSGFEGTGVGLATVQRIVHRHKGRIWATGKPDEGAVFYFSEGN